MARFPKIDQPCPLDGEAQRRIDGHCNRCGKTVHRLDGQSDAERAAFMRQATGPVCVSYRLRLGAALALSLAGPAMAADPAGAQCADATTAPVQRLLGTSPASAPMSLRDSGDEDAVMDMPETLMLGGVSRPGEGEWLDVDDASLPDLPLRYEPPSSE